MLNIKDISDLRNYNEVLCDVAVGEPVFLTKNRRYRYVIMDIEEFEKIEAIFKLMNELAKGELSVKKKGYVNILEAMSILGLSNALCKF